MFELNKLLDKIFCKNTWIKHDSYKGNIYRSYIIKSDKSVLRQMQKIRFFRIYCEMGCLYNFKYSISSYWHLEIKAQVRICTGPRVLAARVKHFVFQIIQSVTSRLSNKNRIRQPRPKASSRYNLKIQTPGDSFLPTELRPRMPQSDFHRICRYKT